MNTIEQAREVSARLHDLLGDWTVACEAADTLDALIAELAETVVDRDEWKDEALSAQERFKRAEAEIAALKAQEPAYLIQSDGRCFAYCGKKPLGPGHADATLLKLYLAAGAQGIPEGYQLVPMEPTQEMLTAGHQCPVIDDGSEDGPEDYRAVYKAMLIAAKEQS